MKKKILVAMILAMTVLVGCNQPEAEPIQTAPITNTLKAVTEEVTGAVENVEDKTVEINEMTCMKKVFSEDNEAFCIFYTVRDGVKTVTEVRPEESENLIPVLAYNDQWVKFSANNKTYLADITSDSDFVINEDGVLVRGCYTLLSVPEDTKLPEVNTSEISEV